MCRVQSRQPFEQLMVMRYREVHVNVLHRLLAAAARDCMIKVIGRQRSVNTYHKEITNGRYGIMFRTATQLNLFNREGVPWTNHIKELQGL